MSTLVVLDLGLQEYLRVWKLQHNLVARRSAGEISDTLLLVEHPAVFTLGRGFRKPLSLPSHTSVISVERGGQMTFHGPGQLVGYPILDLRARVLNLHGYLRNLEEVLILTLADFGIIASRRTALTGVWTGDRKIASIGIAVKRWVSYHGFALNVSTDLSYFRAIEPCGLDGTVMTSMSQRLGRRITTAEVKPSLLARFRQRFNAQ